MNAQDAMNAQDIVTDIVAMFDHIVEPCDCFPAAPSHSSFPLCDCRVKQEKVVCDHLIDVVQRLRDGGIINPMTALGVMIAFTRYLGNATTTNDERANTNSYLWDC